LNYIHLNKEDKLSHNEIKIFCIDFFTEETEVEMLNSSLIDIDDMEKYR